MSAPRRRLPIGTILFVLFTGFTLLEIWLIFLLAEWTSWLFTIAVAIGSALLGSWMAKREGLAVFARAQAELRAGRFPGTELADGVLILAGGLLLITPGLVTDLIGFSTLLAPCRRVYRRVVTRWAQRHFKLVAPGVFAGPGFGAGFGGPPPRDPNVRVAEPGTYSSTVKDADVVDVEFKRTD